MFVVLDMDETLADCSHRAHFVEKEVKDWDAFFAPERVIQDPVIPGAERVLAKFVELKYEIVVLTGRDESLRDTTMRWLLEKLNLSLPDGYLLMRQEGNMLTPAQYKREQLMNFKNGLENKDNNFLIIDDDAQAGAALEGLGVFLKAPECWTLLFAEPEPATDSE
jgi:hydroxymethylpyrimidine pyrophosphatase-like HAD family hydrolase